MREDTMTPCSALQMYSNSLPRAKLLVSSCYCVTCPEPDIYCRHCQQKANMLMPVRQCLAFVVLMSVTGGAWNRFLCSVPFTFLLSVVSKWCMVWWKADRLEIMNNEKLSNWLNRKFKNTKLASAVWELWQQWEQVCVYREKCQSQILMDT
jgi:hypothetical protein